MVAIYSYSYLTLAVKLTFKACLNQHPFIQKINAFACLDDLCVHVFDLSSLFFCSISTQDKLGIGLDA